MPFSLKMSKNIKSPMRHLKYSYILIFTNLLWTDHFMTIYIIYMLLYIIYIYAVIYYIYMLLYIIYIYTYIYTYLCSSPYRFKYVHWPPHRCYMDEHNVCSVASEPYQSDISFASDTAHVVFIHVTSVVKPVHIVMARSSASKSCLVTGICFHCFVHFG